jgi:hypothetical protein
MLLKDFMSRTLRGLGGPIELAFVIPDVEFCNNLIKVGCFVGYFHVLVSIIEHPAASRWGEVMSL